MKLKIGQIGIGHNHGEAKMLTVRKFPELFEVIGYAEENECWIEKRGRQRGYEGLQRLSVEEIIEGSDVVLIESDVRDLTKYDAVVLFLLHADDDDKGSDKTDYLCGKLHVGESKHENSPCILENVTL